MRQRLEYANSFLHIVSYGDAIKLLPLIKGITYNYQSQKYLPQEIHVTKKRLYQCNQSCNMTMQAYYEHFMNVVNVVDHIGGTIGLEPDKLNTVARSYSKGILDLSDVEKHEAREQ